LHRGPKPGIARRLHGHAIEQAELDELHQLDTGDDAFVHDDGQRALLFQALVAAQAAGKSLNQWAADVLGGAAHA